MAIRILGMHVARAGRKRARAPEDQASGEGGMIVCADARQIPLADESVQCVVTSPPYWGLRKYAGEQELVWGHESGCAHEWLEESVSSEIRTGLGLAKLGEQYRGGGHKQGEIGTFTVHRRSCAKCGAWRGAFGLEPTVGMYVQHTVEILREVRRVLRSDGVCFWNIGDSYAAPNGRNSGGIYQSDTRDFGKGTIAAANTPSNRKFTGLKPKDLCLIPQRVALAAQADDWWVRSDIIWAKPNPIPESVTDRPTDAYEHILMLTKSASYYWDQEAVREAKAESTVCDSRHNEDGHRRERGYPGAPSMGGTNLGGPTGGRNLRNVWTFATQPYKGAHFATFPEELPRRCIKAATSAKGACAQCGAPWARVVRATGGTIGKSWHNHVDDTSRGQRGGDDGHNKAADLYHTRNTIGWQPTCHCRGQHDRTVPCLVLDPFAGSGTVGRVAIELQRRCVLLDLAYTHEYKPLAETRTSEVQIGLLV